MINENVFEYFRERLQCKVITRPSVVIDDVSYDAESRIVVGRWSFEACEAKDMSAFDSACDFIKKEYPSFMLLSVAVIPVSQDHCYRVLAKGIWR